MTAPASRFDRLLGNAAVASCVAYSSLMSAGRVAAFRETLPPIAGAWLPTAILVAAVILLSRRTPNPEPRTATNGEPERRTEPEHELSSENREA